MAFEAFWNNVVLPWWEVHSWEPGLSMPDQEMVKAELMAAYHELNLYCSETYMDNPNAPLNQRKIAACMALAIVAVHPISVDYHAKGCMEPLPSRDGKTNKASVPVLANERLAVSAMASIISSYVEKAIWDTELCDLSDSERASCQSTIEGGIDFLQEDDCGEWLLNLEKSLGLTAIEGNMNIPILSCLVAYLESTLVPRPFYQKVLEAFDRAAIAECR